MSRVIFLLLTACQVAAIGDRRPEEESTYDADGDSILAGEDCDDTDANIHPKAHDVPADGVDQDCDGLDACPADHDGDGFGGQDTVLVSLTAGCGTVPGSATARDDCDDDDPTVGPATTWFLDGDGDGYGRSDTSTQACRPSDGWSPTPGDCDDSDPTTHPAAEDAPGDEIDADCDGIDPCWRDADGDGLGGLEVVPGIAAGCPEGATHLGGDCDDDDAAIGLRSWYLDQDGDGLGDASMVHVACTPPPGWVANATDCDDQDATLPALWFADVDGDGHGDPLDATLGCEAIEGRVSTSDDCDDGAAHIHPGLPEVCNGEDDDCNGFLDAADPGIVDASPGWVDADADGWGAGAAHSICPPEAGFALQSGDCDDDWDQRAPDLPEVPYDGIDQDCDGVDLLDVDRDGYLGGEGGADCDDNDASVHPNATEICNDHIDQDCRGRTPSCLLAANASLQDADARIALSSDEPELFGWSLASAEVTGDGIPDLLVGAPGLVDDVFAAGSIYVLHGEDLPLGRSDTSQAWGHLLGTTFGHTGVSLAATPDALWATSPLYQGGAVARIPTPLQPGERSIASEPKVQSYTSGLWLGALLHVDPRTGLALALDRNTVAPSRAWALTLPGYEGNHSLTEVTDEGLGWSLGPATGSVETVALGTDPMEQSDTGWAVAWTVGTTAFLHLGSGLPTQRVAPLGISSNLPTHEAILSLSGRAEVPLITVSLAPDLTGDDHADLVVGLSCPAAPCQEPDEVWVVPGPLDGGSVQALSADSPGQSTRLVAPADGTIHPWSISHTADADGDGRPDLLLGAGSLEAGKGRAWLLYAPLPQGTYGLGRTGLDLPGASWSSTSANLFGQAVVGIEDLDGDGFDEVAISAPFTPTPRATLPGMNPTGGVVYVWFGRGD